MNTNLYFKYEDSEICYSEEYFQHYMIENNLSSMEVWNAHKDKIDGIFWCKEYRFCGDKGCEPCGKECEKYLPKNGKSGCCKYYTNILYVHGNKTTLKLKEITMTNYHLPLLLECRTIVDPKLIPIQTIK